MSAGRAIVGRGGPTRRTVFTAALLLAAPLAAADDGFLILGSTTTTENSGLLDHLRPRFEADTGLALRVVVAGTGRILRLAEAGDIDVALTHHPEAERAFIANGNGAYRRDVMWNDFLLVGPAEDPAGVAEATDVLDAMRRLARSEALFLSRGDDSGTHAKERFLWFLAGAEPDGGYRETGAGMGATLNVAAASGGYTLVDRGTWASFGAKDGMAELREGDAVLGNPYSVILPSPERNPRLRRAEAETFIAWITGDAGRAAINGFEIDGAQVFLASPPGAAPSAPLGGEAPKN